MIRVRVGGDVSSLWYHPRSRSALISAPPHVEHFIRTRGSYPLAKTPRTWTGARTPSGLKRVRHAERRHEVLQPRRTAAKTYVAKALTARPSRATGIDRAGPRRGAQRPRPRGEGRSDPPERRRAPQVAPDDQGQRRRRWRPRPGRRPRREDDRQGRSPEGREGTHRRRQGRQGQGRPDGRRQGPRRAEPRPPAIRGRRGDEAADRDRDRSRAKRRPRPAPKATAPKAARRPAAKAGRAKKAAAEEGTPAKAAKAGPKADEEGRAARRTKAVAQELTAGPSALTRADSIRRRRPHPGRRRGRAQRPAGVGLGAGRSRGASAPPRPRDPVEQRRRPGRRTDGEHEQDPGRARTAGSSRSGVNDAASVTPAAASSGRRPSAR